MTHKAKTDEKDGTTFQNNKKSSRFNRVDTLQQGTESVIT